MRDVVHIFSEYFSRKLENIEDDRFKIEIPSDFIEHIIRFYLSQFLYELHVSFEGSGLRITGVNLIPIEVVLKIKSINWSEKQKVFEINVEANEFVLKTIKGLLKLPEKKRDSFVSFENGIISVDLEVLFAQNPRINSLTYSLRNRVKLDSVVFKSDRAEFYFQKLTP